MTSGSTGSTFPRWQLALLLGAPVALTLGYLYYRQSSSATIDGANSKKKKPSLDSKTVSIDDQSSPAEAQSNNKKKEPLTPLDQAIEHKNKGNEHFRAGKYDEAIECYDKAIHNCPSTNITELATFYQNRAAAHENLKNWPAVRDDCTKALELNVKYTKAYHRRAKAHEQMGDLSSSLEDITATCIIERFTNQSTLIFADRVLKTLGSVHAKAAMETRVPVKPSKHFVKSFMSSFGNDPLKKVVVVASGEQRGFLRANHAMETFDFDQVIPACSEEIEQAGTASPYHLEALLLRGTMYELTGEFDRALADFNAVLDSTTERTYLSGIKVNALIKRASIHIQMDKPQECFDDFAQAVQLDALNADIYYHRGQMYTLLMRFDEAVTDFNKTIQLRPDFSLAVIQKLYVEYRDAVAQQNQMKLIELMEGFKEAIEKYSDCVECYSILAQILSEQGQFGEADQFFEKALKLDGENATLHVHRALLLLQWKGDVQKGMELLYKAITVDDRCGFAYETLASVEVQRGMLEKAIELFDQAISLAKSETEIAHLFSLKDAAIAQINVSRKMGLDVAQLASMAAQSMG